MLLYGLIEYESVATDTDTESLSKLKKINYKNKSIINQLILLQATQWNLIIGIIN